MAQVGRGPKPATEAATHKEITKRIALYTYSNRTMTFSQFITDLTLFATDVVAKVPEYLENELLLSKEQVLLTLLTCSFFYAFVSIKFNITNPIVCIVVVGLVAITSVIIECRVTLSNKVYDMGHEVLTPLFPISDPATNKLFAAVNTAFCLSIAFYSVFSCLVLGRRNIVAKGALSIFLRMLCGLSTRLPVPENIVILEGDWPPSRTAALAGYNPVDTRHWFARINGFKITWSL